MKVAEYYRQLAAFGFRSLVSGLGWWFALLCAILLRRRCQTGGAAKGPFRCRQVGGAVFALGVDGQNRPSPAHDGRPVFVSNGLVSLVQEAFDMLLLPFVGHNGKY